MKLFLLEAVHSFMRSLLLFALVWSSTLAWSSPAVAETPINAVVGDASWLASEGRPPRSTDSEPRRIRAHLAWVIAELTRAGESLEPEVRARRAALLTELGRYRRAGLFPRNTAAGETSRRPRFMDDRGHLCAVGHLIAATAGIDLVREINAEHEYDYLSAIRHEGLAEWASSSGFNTRELAMIQPTYATPSDEDRREMLRRLEQIYQPGSDAVVRRQLLTWVRRARECIVQNAGAERVEIVLAADVFPNLPGWTGFEFSERLGHLRGSASVSSAPASPALEACFAALPTRFNEQLDNRYYFERRIQMQLSIAVMAETGEVIFLPERPVLRAVRRALRQHRRALLRCFPRESAGELRITAKPDQSLAALSVSELDEDGSILSCVNTVLESVRIRPRVTHPQTVRHSLRVE